MGLSRLVHHDDSHPPRYQAEKKERMTRHVAVVKTPGQGDFAAEIESNL